jgi:hypothetical protein
MITGDDAGPLEQSWLCQGWRIMVRDDFPWPEVFEPDGATAVLVLPSPWATTPEGREAGVGVGIARVFLGRYGKVMLMRGIRCWPELAEQLAERDRDFAAD